MNLEKTEERIRGSVRGKKGEVTVMSHDVKGGQEEEE